jgi:hypothetical protein
MPRPFQTDAVIVIGPLAHHRLSNDLFHIDGPWMRVEPGTVFHRWMLSGAGPTAAIGVTLDPDRFADLPNVRTMTGRLIHQTVPSASPIVHAFLMPDPQSGLIGAVTFQTKDRLVAEPLEAWTGIDVNLVIEIRTE